jgi:hypothetical protein
MWGQAGANLYSRTPPVAPRPTSLGLLHRLGGEVEVGRAGGARPWCWLAPGTTPDPPLHGAGSALSKAPALPSPDPLGPVRPAPDLDHPGQRPLRLSPDGALEPLPKKAVDHRGVRDGIDPPQVGALGSGRLRPRPSSFSTSRAATPSCSQSKRFQLSSLA